MVKWKLSRLVYNQIITRFAVHTPGQTEAGLTQIADMESELSQLQNLNANLEEDLLAAEHAGSHTGRAGNGHDPKDEAQHGFDGECCCRGSADCDTCNMPGASDSHPVPYCCTFKYAYQHLIASRQWHKSNS